MSDPGHSRIRTNVSIFLFNSHSTTRKFSSQNVSTKKTIIFRLRIVLFGPIAPRVYHHYDDYKAMIALYFKFGFCDDNQKIIFSGSYASDDKNITLYTGA